MPDPSKVRQGLDWRWKTRHKQGLTDEAVHCHVAGVSALGSQAREMFGKGKGEGGNGKGSFCDLCTYVTQDSPAFQISRPFWYAFVKFAILKDERFAAPFKNRSAGSKLINCDAAGFLLFTAFVLPYRGVCCV